MPYDPHALAAGLHPAEDWAATTNAGCQGKLAYFKLLHNYLDILGALCAAVVLGRTRTRRVADDHATSTAAG